MISTEVNFMPEYDFMRRQTHITSAQRLQTINWLIQVQITLRLLPETLFIAVNIMDRYLCKERICTKKFQLLAVTALLIASKFQEIYPPIISDFVHMTGDAYYVQEVHQMEAFILNSIEFEINCTPSQTFLENYAGAILVSDPRVLIFASFLLDIALLREEFLQFRTSHVTMSALDISL